MEIRSKEFAVRAEAADPTEDDLALINGRYALAPLAADQVYVRRLALCNDQYDRTGERFPRFYLERFAETLPGKPLLAHHDHHQFPLGRFFRAEVVEVQSPGSPVQSPTSQVQSQDGLANFGPWILDCLVNTNQGINTGDNLLRIDFVFLNQLHVKA